MEAAFLLQSDKYYILYRFPGLSERKDTDILRHEFNHSIQAFPVMREIQRQGYNAFLLKLPESAYWNSYLFDSSPKYRGKIHAGIINEFLAEVDYD